MNAPSLNRFTRRHFLRAAAASAAAAPSAGIVSGAESTRTRKTVLSFYCDDTSPSTAGAKAFGMFLDFSAERRIAGEASLILGMGGRCIAREPKGEEQAFLRQVQRAWSCGIDSHVELMTHHGLFDFENNREKANAVHEGLWLHEPEVSVKQYEDYIGAILQEGGRAGVKFTGVTWPGCGCTPCKQRYAALQAAGHTEPNPALWPALLNIAKQGRFRGKTVPCFLKASETKFGCNQKAAEGGFGVFDLMPNAMDHFGTWRNDAALVNADYYISADGKSGIVAHHIEAGAPYCLWYSHWQGLNPVNGLGWQAFVTVIDRIQTHFGDRVVWMRPSDITSRYLAAGGWGFLNGLDGKGNSP